MLAMHTQTHTSTQPNLIYFRYLLKLVYILTTLSQTSMMFCRKNEKYVISGEKEKLHNTHKLFFYFVIFL